LIHTQGECERQVYTHEKKITVTLTTHTEWITRVQVATQQ